MNSVDSIAKISFGCYPTPIHELPNISRAMGDGKRLYLKREDLCGIGFGGNKIRKLEYLLGDAISQNCDCIVTGGGSLSNQPIAAAACANRVGLPAYLVLPKTVSAISRRLAEQMGASIIISENEPSNSVAKLIRQTAKVLREQGHNPYIIPPGASSVHGVLGYTDAMKEMYEQAAKMGVSIDHIVCCGGTGNTYAGVVLGTKLYSPSTTATVISIGRRFCHKETLCKMANEAQQLLGTDTLVTEEDMHIFFSCGKGHGSETPKGRAAMGKMAALEGIFLDPIYTGKAFAGVLELNETGVFHSGQVIVFLHTGGMAALLGSIAK